VFPLRTTCVTARSIHMLCPDKAVTLDGSTAIAVEAATTCMKEGKVLSAETLSAITTDITGAISAFQALVTQLKITAPATAKKCNDRCAATTPREVLARKLEDMDREVKSALHLCVVEPDGGDCIRKVFVPFTTELQKASVRATGECLTKASVEALMPKVTVGSRTFVVGSKQFLAALDREAVEVLHSITHKELQQLLNTEKKADKVKEEAAVLGGPLAQTLHVLFGWNLEHIYDSMYMFAVFNAGIKTKSLDCKSATRETSALLALSKP
jgi:hypothetical protein